MNLLLTQGSAEVTVDKFRFRFEGNFSSERFLLRWPSLSLLSYFFLTPALSCMFVLCAPVVVRQRVAARDVCTVRPDNCSSTTSTNAALIVNIKRPDRVEQYIYMTLWNSRKRHVWCELMVITSVFLDYCSDEQAEAKQDFSIWFVTF